MEPLSLGIGVGAAMVINKVVDFFGHKKSSAYKAQKERDERLEELQKLQQRENQLHQNNRDAQSQAFQKQRDIEQQSLQRQRDAEQQAFQLQRDAEQQAFQLQRDAEQRHFQLEIEANRMAFQERIEMRRLQVQKQLEKEREQLAITLNNKNNEVSREIARFNAIAMRETQILVARENAQNLLQDRMVQDALKNFPLNISPLVLLKNRPHSLSSLLRFTIGEKCNITDVVDDVLNYVENPEALNVFVAPVYVDSKIKNREILSKQIWDTTYQRLESFFTTHYNRRSPRPVIFYPTAWNDKYSPGMHASETLHFFLRDMPCIVLEPRFDGNNFRIMVSSWGLGYTSTEHNRTEMNFNINIDAVLAQSVYQRSKAALNVLDDLVKADINENEKAPFYMQRRILERNIKLFETLGIGERIERPDKMNEIDAFGIYNIFKIEPMQDLSLLSDTLSAQIGMTLATLTDIHHLRSTDTKPAFPELMKNYFPSLYNYKELRSLLCENYERVYRQLREDDLNQIFSSDKRLLMSNIRESQINAVKIALELTDGKTAKEEFEQQVSKYCWENFGYKDKDFEMVWETCLDEMTTKDKPFFEVILPQINDVKKQRQLKQRLNKL